MFGFRWACAFFTSSFLDNCADVKEFFPFSHTQKEKLKTVFFWF